jgi:hypothetical protein
VPWRDCQDDPPPPRLLRPRKSPSATGPSSSGSKCHSLADLPMFFCSPLTPDSPSQLLPSAAVAERSPAQRSAAEAAPFAS